MVFWERLDRLKGLRCVIRKTRASSGRVSLNLIVLGHNPNNEINLVSTELPEISEPHATF